ncbi:MAG: copper chaperone PCu(A)C [Caldimonas sp.]
MGLLRAQAENLAQSAHLAHLAHLALLCWLLGCSIGVAHALMFSVTEPWVRATPDGRNAEMFMKLRSSDPATLVAIDSFAARVTTILQGQERQPRQQVPLPANAEVEFKPGSLRIQLSGLVRPLKRGEHVPLTLFVRGADGTVQKTFVQAEVRKRSPTEDELDPRGHSHRK